MTRNQPNKTVHDQKPTKQTQLRRTAREEAALSVAMDEQVTWCFTPSQLLRLYQGVWMNKFTHISISVDLRSTF